MVCGGGVFGFGGMLMVVESVEKEKWWVEAGQSCS
jgi:hypothetical protein